MGLAAALKDAPWEAIQAGITAFRVRYATIDFDTDSVDSYVVAAPLDADAVEGGLRRRHLEGTYLAYNYRGELFNLRRPEPPESLVDANSIPDTAPYDKPMELHVRGFEHPDGIELIAHLEASRYEAKGDHINEVNFSWAVGGEMLREEIEALGWDYEHVPAEG